MSQFVLLDLACYLAEHDCDVQWRKQGDRQYVAILMAPSVETVATGAARFDLRASYSAGAGWEFEPKEQP